MNGPLTIHFFVCMPIYRIETGTECVKMEINNFNISPSAMAAGIQDKGEVQQLVIKKRMGDNEAQVVLNGKETTVKFDGPIPKQDRILVEVTPQKQNGLLVVKPIPEQASVPAVRTAEDILQKAGFNPAAHPELKEAVRQILSNNGTVSKEVLANLSEFLQEADGSPPDKLDTIKLMQQKGIEYTEPQLNAVHAALNGEALGEVLGKFIETPAEQDNRPNVVANQHVNKPETQHDASDHLASMSRMLGDSVPVHPANEAVTDLKNPDVLLENGMSQSSAIDSKRVLVTKVTKQLSQLTIDFKAAQQEISKSLDTVLKITDTKNILPARQVLTSVIDKLDKTILKGDFMLYADMATEKDMLQASSKLAEARNLLAKGFYPEAKKIVADIKSLIDQTVFKPNTARIENFVSEEPPEPTVEKMIQPFLQQEPGARRIFEAIKGLGFTHELDVAGALENKQEVPANLKSILLQMQEMQGDQSKIAQALNTVTGQQLVNKQDLSGIQNLYLQLPLLLDQKIENVKVYMRSQKEGKKIDWENCTLYFVLETKKLGEVGISLSAVNRNLSVVFKNDQKAFKEDVLPFVDEVENRLQNIGYHIGSIQFKPFSPPVEKESEKAEKSKRATEKGFDFSV